MVVQPAAARGARPADRMIPWLVKPVVAGADGALSAGTTYGLAVRAVSDAGESPLSAVVEVTTATE